MSRGLFVLLVLLLFACDPGRGGGLPDIDTRSAPDARPDGFVPVTDLRDGDEVSETRAPPLDLSVPDLPPDQSPPLLFNEVLTKDPGGGPDWFELIAAGDEAVHLADFSVVDGDPSHFLESLPDVWLEPGELYTVEAVGVGGWTPSPHVPFKLGGNDSLVLASGGQLVDRVDWHGQGPPTGTSLCRLPDGDPVWRLCRPTAGGANEDLNINPYTCYDPFLWDRVISVELALDSGAWESMLAAPEAEAYFMGDFLFDTMEIADVAIRIKGGSSISEIAAGGTNRFSFKVDFNKYVPFQKLCGFGKVFLNNGWGDPSLLREHLAFRLARSLGVPAPRSAFVDLTVAGQRLGVYLMVEPVDDDAFLEENFADDKGDLYEAEPPAGALADLGPTFGDYPGLDLKTNQGTTTHTALLAFIEALNHGQPETWPLVLRINDTLRYLAWNTVLTNLDSYNGTGANYYLYEKDGVFSLVPWDADEAFGAHGCGCGPDALLNFALDEPTCGPLAERPLLEKLLAVPEYAGKYRGYVEALLSGGFEPATFALWKEAAADIIRPKLEEGVYFQSVDAFEAALADGTDGGPFGLQSFVVERSGHLADQLVGAAPTTHGGLGNCPPETR